MQNSLHKMKKLMCSMSAQQHGLAADIKRSEDADPPTLRPRVGGYGLEAEVGGAGPTGVNPRAGGTSSMGGFGLQADVDAAGRGGGGGSSRGGAPPATDFQGFGPAVPPGSLAAQQTTGRLAPHEVDRQADVMTRRGGGGHQPSMVRCMLQWGAGNGQHLSGLK